jgi:xanthine dehydrogenase YagS FAD-binding subunit
MKDIKHVNVTTVDAAVAELKKGKSAVIAGGTDLVQGMKAMVSPNAPETLVNIKGIAALKKLVEEGGMLKIGPLTTLTEIAESSVVQTKYTALAQAARKVASPELRNMGTIGGNICQGVRCWYYRGEHNVFPCLRKSSSGLCYALAGDNRYHSIFGAVSGCVAVNPSDMAPALVAMDAKIVTSKKTVAAQDFFAAKIVPAGEGTTVLDADEIVTEIQVPTPAAGVKSAFVKFAARQAFDFPIVNCAAMIGGGAARICMNAVHNLPRRATGAEDSIKGKTIDNTTAEAAAAAAVTGTITLAASGFGPGNKYMVQIARTMVKRAILACK